MTAHPDVARSFRTAIGETFMKKILMISLIWSHFIFLSHNVHAKSWPPKDNPCVQFLQIPFNIAAYYGAGVTLGPILGSLFSDGHIKNILSEPMLWLIMGIGNTANFSYIHMHIHGITPYEINLALNPGLVASSQFCEFFEEE